MTAALEQEADRLESLAAGARVGGGDGAVALLAQLAEVEARVWRWQAAAEAAREGLRGGAAPVEADGPGESFAPIPALGLVTGDDAAMARLRPLLTDWAAYQSTLGRVLRLLADLRVSAVTGAPGLPAAGRVCPVAGPHWFEPTWAEGRGLGAGPQRRGRACRAGHAPAGHRERHHRAGGLALGRGDRGVPGGALQRRRVLLRPPGRDRAGYSHGAGGRGRRPARLGGVHRERRLPHLHLGWIPHARGGVDLEGLADPFPLLVGLCGPG